jgi:hypothetical protein
MSQNPGPVESVQRWVTSCREILQSALILLLALFAITALAYPPWAHTQLGRLGFQVSEISIAGVKLVVNQSFAISDALADAQTSLAKARDALKAAPNGDTGASTALDAAVKRVADAQAALSKQGKGTKDLQAKAGLQPDLPDYAWVFVGRQSEEKLLQPSPRVDAGRTSIVNDQVKTLTLKQDTMVDTVDDCTKTDIADVRPVSQKELQRIVILLSAGTYEVSETNTCPSVGRGKFISARIQLNPDRVRLAKFADVKS